jgi:hypothetical protein
LGQTRRPETEAKKQAAVWAWRLVDASDLLTKRSHTERLLLLLSLFLSPLMIMMMMMSALLLSRPEHH